MRSAEGLGEREVEPDALRESSDVVMSCVEEEVVIVRSCREMRDEGEVSSEVVDRSVQILLSPRMKSITHHSSLTVSLPHRRYSIKVHDTRRPMGGGWRAILAQSRRSTIWTANEVANGWMQR